MGIFTGIGAITPDGSRYKKSIRSLERMKSKIMITNAKNALALNKIDAPRQQAAFKQGMFARGLGKSTIFDQDKERLDLVQAQRLKQLEQNLRYARYYKTYLTRKHHWEKVSQYYEAIDGIIGFVGGASSSPSMAYGADPYAAGGGMGEAAGGAYGGYGGAGAAGAGAASAVGNYYTGY